MSNKKNKKSACVTNGSNTRWSFKVVSFFKVISKLSVCVSVIVNEMGPLKLKLYIFFTFDNLQTTDFFFKDH